MYVQTNCKIPLDRAFPSRSGLIPDRMTVKISWMALVMETRAVAPLCVSHNGTWAFLHAVTRTAPSNLFYKYEFGQSEQF